MQNSNGGLTMPNNPLIPLNNLVLSRRDVMPGTEWNPCEFGVCFLLLMKGKLTLNSDNRVRRLTKGDVVVLRQNSLSVVRAVAGQEASVCYFQFQPESLNGFISDGESHFLKLPSLLWRDTVSFHPAGSPLAQSFFNFVGITSPPGTLAYTGRVFQLIASLVPDNLSSVDPAINLENLDTTTKSRIVSIIDHIPETEFEELSVEEIARKCVCSRRQLARVFHEHYGCTVTSRKMDIRLEKAKKMLFNSNLKVIEIAFQCGFSHLGQFSSKFKKRYGVTPALWRRQFLSKATDAITKRSRFSRKKRGRHSPPLLMANTPGTEMLNGMVSSVLIPDR